MGDVLMDNRLQIVHVDEKPGGVGGTWVLNGYPLPNGHAERKQSMSNIRSGEPPLFFF